MIEASLPSHFAPFVTPPKDLPISPSTFKEASKQTPESQPNLPPTSLQVCVDLSKEESDEEIPQSMSEIFKLSNQIKRKRNKEKRKLREESSKDDERLFHSSFFLAEMEILFFLVTKNPKNKKQKEIMPSSS